MSESLQGPKTERAFEQEYLELTKKQTSSVKWTNEDRKKLLELKELLGIDQPKSTQEQRNALHRQGTADTRLTTGEKLQPPLTKKEEELITNIDPSRSS